MRGRGCEESTRKGQESSQGGDDDEPRVRHRAGGRDAEGVEGRSHAVVCDAADEDAAAHGDLDGELAAL